jgi:anti-sigma factor RsiW
MKIDDVTLLSYVDGELPPAERDQVEAAIAHSEELAAQVSALRASCLPYRMAFDRQPLPPMPPNLAHNVAAWVTVSKTPSPAPRPAGARWFGAMTASRRAWMGMGVAMAASFAAGVVVPDLLNREGDTGWADPIVVYQSLYTRETVASLKEDADQTVRVLAEYGLRAGRSVSVPDLRSEGLEFKRAQILAMQNSPLLQLVYLGATGKPVALCLLPQSERPNMAVDDRVEHGMDVATWRRHGIAFALVSDLGAERSGKIAHLLAQGRYQALRGAQA